MISIPDMERLAPLFSVAGTILNTKALVDGGIEPTFADLLLPSLVMTYGPSLFANTLYSRFEMTPEGIGLFAVGFVLSIFVHSNSFLMSFIDEIPYVSKILALVKMKNSTEDTFSMMSWMISRDIAGACIGSLILRRRLRMKAVDLLNMGVVYGGVLVLRRYGLRDYYVIIVAGVAPLAIKAISCIDRKKPVEDKTVHRVRTPRRRASAAAKLTKKE